MVGRNDKCPCGSGEKYKKCCLIKMKDSVNFSSLNDSSSAYPGSFMLSSDPRLEPIKKLMLENYYFEQKNPYFLYDIGTSLGLIGFADDALLYCKKALKYLPKKDNYAKNLLLTNLGQMYADVGDIKRGLSELSKVPDTFPRKKLIEANIRLKYEPFENVIENYQFAIEQEPDFFLPYEHLISRLEITDPRREFLVNSALANMPNSPIAALYWADQELFNENYSDLAKSKWIDSVNNFDLSSSKERDIINFSAELPMIFKTLYAIHNLSKLMDLAYSGNKSIYANQPNKDEHSISVNTEIAKILPHLAKVKSEFRCNLSKRLIDCFATYGKPEELIIAHSALCEDCREHLDFEQALFSSYCRYPKTHKMDPGEIENIVDKAIKISQNVIASKSVIKASFINDLLDFIDDWVSTEKVLEVAELIFDLDSERIEKFDVVEELRLNWNLGIMAGKSNNWLLAERFISKALSMNFDDSEKKRAQRFEKTREQLRQRILDNYLEIRSHGHANLAVTYLGQRKLDEAEDIRDKLVNGAYDYLPERHFIEELNKLINWVKGKSDFSSFKNEFRSQVAKTSFCIFYGERPTFKNSKFSLSETITKVNSDKISDQIRAHKAIEHFSILDSEDLSEIHNSIEADLPNFRSLPENARKSLVAAEALRLKSKSIFDSAPAIMSYCKAFEICLKEFVFREFVNQIKNYYDLDEVVEEAKQDKKFPQFRSFINYIASGYLEIGSASQCIKLSLGKTGARVTLLREFCAFLNNRYPSLMIEENLNMIEKLSIGYRNPAVHEQNFSIDDLEAVRVKCCLLIGNIVSVRLLRT